MSTPFADLFKQNPQDIGRVTKAFQRIIEASFAAAETTGRPTGDEIKRRFQICEKWFRDLRGQKKWTISRTIDAIPLALKSELTGVYWEPDTRAIWTPGR